MITPLMTNAIPNTATVVILIVLAESKVAESSPNKACCRYLTKVGVNQVRKERGPTDDGLISHKATYVSDSQDSARPASTASTAGSAYTQRTHSTTQHNAAR